MEAIFLYYALATSIRNEARKLIRSRINWWVNEHDITKALKIEHK